MTREEFLRAVTLQDKKQGNYKETTQWMTLREERLKRVSQNFIDTYEYLVGKGYKVFVMERLQGNGVKSKPKRWSHLYIPEINTSVRFWGKAKNEIQDTVIKKTLWRYLKEVRDYCYTFVMHPESDIKYVEEKVAYCKGFFDARPRKGIENNIVIPPKKKRERIKAAPTYERVERKPIG